MTVRGYTTEVSPMFSHSPHIIKCFGKTVEFFGRMLLATIIFPVPFSDKGWGHPQRTFSLVEIEAQSHVFSMEASSPPFHVLHPTTVPPASPHSP